MKTILTILTLTTTLLICSCENGMTRMNKVVTADVADNATEESVAPASPDKVDNPVERKIIKEGELSFETGNINDTRKLVTKTVQELNGYISKDNGYDYNDRLEQRIVIRVPADKFDALLDKISSAASKIDSKSIDVLDVTEEYIDVESRIKTKKELEEKYKELLKRATKVEEILNIEKEIGLLRTEIESVEGRMKYLKDRIAFSTLTVTYYEKTSSAFGFSLKFKQAIKGGWDGFLIFLIGLTQLWVSILLAIVVVTAVLFARKRRKKSSV